MSALLLILIAIVIFVAAYLTYGKWLAKQWGIDPSVTTPAHEMEDGVDYCPAKTPVLMGHHFSSIAGAGPINGPIQAAFFGWVPVFLWIVIGGIFFGAVQDFGSIFVSIRHKGKSLGEVIEENIGHKCKVLFTVFAWLVLLLVVAAFADIVANSFTIPEGGSTANGSVATASILFIPLAIAFGFFVYRKNVPMGLASIVGVILLAACVVIGLLCPVSLPKNFWIGFVFIYVMIASVTPVWILLQPRDYLSSFLLYFMIIAAIVGIVGASVVGSPLATFSTPAFVGFKVGSNYLFPTLFITVACGAVSGFHSLIGSGTTSKQLDSEKDALAIGYGSMLIECVLAVISLIAISVLSTNGAMPEGMASPTIVFASAIRDFFIAMGFGQTAATATYTIIALAVSAFCLTSLDTATRLGRFMFQELFAGNGEKQNILSNMYVATIITAFFGFVLCLAGYQNVWPLFGACNQLVAVPAFLAVAVFLARKGKNNKMLYFPMVFMLCATLTSLVLTFKNNIVNLTSGTGTIIKEGLQCIIIIPIVILALILVVEGVKVLMQVEKSHKK
ncbi:MAG: carbon starvation protein A [Lachnospiraceae bacterium]|nr:carbon starvation protein A [Lachnospiraceae bacterium]GFI15368.1 peptide transporter CstA [Lachnospiraceae bacterium]